MVDMLHPALPLLESISTSRGILWGPSEGALKAILANFDRCWLSKPYFRSLVLPGLYEMVGHGRSFYLSCYGQDWVQAPGVHGRT